MAIESFWNPGVDADGTFNNKGGNWFADKDLEDISNALGQMTGPMLQQAIQEYARSMTPEGRRRLYMAYRDQLMQDAMDQGGYDNAILQAQGQSPSLRTGVRLNRINSARLKAAGRLKELNDPSRNLQTTLGLYSSLYGMRNPKSQGGSFLGDLFGLAGDVLPFVSGIGGSKPSKSAGMSGATSATFKIPNPNTLQQDQYGNYMLGGLEF